MMYLQLLLCSLQIFLSSHTPITTANALLGGERDRMALLEFKREISSDPLAVLSSWNDSTAFCKWRGVTCNRRHERVTTLNLFGLGLLGSLSPHIGNLTFLRRLRLAKNSFHGSIPPQIGRLFRLQYISFANNTFAGEIPVQMSNCSKLVFVDFERNKLVGAIPSQFGSLTKLEWLELGRNNLTGTIPASVGNMSSLNVFRVVYNKLTKSIPDDIGRLRNLSVLIVGGNRLSGTIPLSLYNISSLARISLADNNFTGTLPTNIGLTLPNLEGLFITMNEFSGPIPASLCNASKLDVLVLSINQLVGQVPRDLGNLVGLTGLGFSSNNLGSNSTNDLEFLASFRNSSQLQILDMSDNNFGGFVPMSIANLSSQLGRLYLSGNQLYGAIPEKLERYSDLYLLDLSYNLFEGVIPSSYGMLKAMQMMSLEGNRLVGEIPNSLGNLTRLIQLSLANNHLHGSIPLSVGKWKSLQNLDLSENILTGTIPKELVSLSSLTISLNISQNSLTGSIPMEVKTLKNSYALDFSENNLSGEIPTTFGDCESLQYLFLQGNSFQGKIPLSLASLRGLTYVDLSRNKLSGNIPSDLSNLRLSYFNASFNDLEGQMPTKGAFANSSAISVLGNKKLCGGIPELHLPECPDLKSRKQGMSHAKKLVIIITSSIICIVLLSFLMTLYWKTKSKRRTLITEDIDPYRVSKVSYKMLHDGTSGFSQDNLVGFGSFGSVYKGILDQEERVVAIKVLNLQQKGASKSFMAECMALRNIRHRNLVKIITSCSSIDYKGNDFKALVFEFMENSSLVEWLHSTTGNENYSRNLNFLERVNIALDVASALYYLHNECEPPIIHCDLKPSNVLLDKDKVAHVGDFGLARILSTTNGSFQKQSSTIGLKGSIGYTAPEYGTGGRESVYGDVYSFGILILEMFTGKSPTDGMFGNGLNIHQHTSMALPERLMEIVDTRLFREEEEEEEINTLEVDTKSHEDVQKINEVIKNCLPTVFEIGVACSVELPKERMKMVEVIRELLLVKKAILGEAIIEPQTRRT